MIEKLTLDQETELPRFRQKMLDIACGGIRVNRKKLQTALNDAYAEIDKGPPTLIILQSPLQAMMAIKFMESFAAGDLGESLYKKLSNEMDDQLWGQLWGQLRDQLGGQLGGQLWGQLRGQQIYNGGYLWGSQDLYWIAWAMFGEKIGVKFTEEQSRRLNIMYRIAEQCEWWWPYEGIVFVSEKPTEVNWDGDVLHGENRPAALYEDGYALYSWRGTAVPKEWIETPETLKPEMALTWENVEQRRCIAEIVGWHNVLDQLDAKTVDKDDDPEIGELLEVDIPDIGRERFLKVVCGTTRDFALPVPPDTKTALDAQAWLNFCTTDDILNLEIRT